MRGSIGNACMELCQTLDMRSRNVPLPYLELCNLPFPYLEIKKSITTLPYLDFLKFTINIFRDMEIYYYHLLELT